MTKVRGWYAVRTAPITDPRALSEIPIDTTDGAQRSASAISSFNQADGSWWQIALDLDVATVIHAVLDRGNPVMKNRFAIRDPSAPR